MGIQVEFNPDLALRNIEEFKAGRRKEAECIPAKLTPGAVHTFLKRGQRLYWLHGEVPLLETQGNQQLSRPIASVVLQEVTHVLQDNEVWTRGTYKVVDVFNDGKAHFDGFERIS